MKRVFGLFEAVFDGLYLITALGLGLVLLLTGSGSAARNLAGLMALVLVGGDAFHLVPRMRVIFTGDEERFRPALGLGKQVTSISMTVFYLLLWQIGLFLFAPKAVEFWSYTFYLLTALRIFLCFLPQNRWKDRYPPVSWGIWRNIPFFLQGLMAAGLFFRYRAAVPALAPMWLAILLSFAFYLPVVLWANKNPKIGMFMLPKTCIYVWMLVLCLSLS